MQFKILEAKNQKFDFRIEEDLPEIGAYLFVYEDGKCIKDFLQNNIDICKELAFEEYGVYFESWIEVIKS